MLEAAALRARTGRHVGMVVEADVVAAEEPRQIALLNASVLTVIGGSSGRWTRANTGASWWLQSMKMDFIARGILLPAPFRERDCHIT